MADIGVYFPISATPVFGFECPLGSDEPNADILTYHNKKNGAQAFLATVSDKDLPLNSKKSTWNKVNGFSSSWEPLEKKKNLEIDDLWLEFDVRDFEGKGIPEPSLFFGPILYNFTQKNPGKDWRPHLLSIIESYLTLLGSIPEQQIDLLHSCIKKLPDHGRIFQVGKMLSREHPGFRICLHNLDQKEVKKYVHQIGLNHDTSEQLAYWCDKLKPYTKKICPAFDLTNKIESKVGVEFYVKNGAEDKPLFYWNQLLDLLIEEKLCTSLKKKGILAYPNLIKSSDVKENWPVSLLKMEAFLNGKKQSAYLLSLHHFKLTFSPNKKPIAKIYLAVKSIWLP